MVTGSNHWLDLSGETGNRYCYLVVLSIVATYTPMGHSSTAKVNTLPVTGHKPTVTPKLRVGSTVDIGTPILVDKNFADLDGDTEDETTSGTRYQWVVKEGNVLRDLSEETGPTFTPSAAVTGGTNNASNLSCNN